MPITKIDPAIQNSYEKINGSVTKINSKIASHNFKTVIKIATLAFAIFSSISYSLSLVLSGALVSMSGATILLGGIVVFVSVLSPYLSDVITNSSYEKVRKINETIDRHFVKFSPNITSSFYNIRGLQVGDYSRISYIQISSLREVDATHAKSKRWFARFR